MNVITPLNLNALRVSSKDNSHVVGQFKGRTAVFEHMPYASRATEASTGDKLQRPLEQDASPPDPLGIGMHLHWELPEYFRRGVQPASGGNVVFPSAPNRWLVTRYLSLYDAASQQYGPPQARSWVVESDYVAPDLDRAPADGVVRPAVTVPLTDTASKQPYRYLGRVVDAARWQEGGAPPANYLSAYADADGQPHRLTAMGFVGPSFSAYYPECRSVFGFWDHFRDQPAVFQALNENLPLRFKATYQVVGWLADPRQDPLRCLPGLAEANQLGGDLQEVVTRQYEQLRRQALAEGQPSPQTPAEVFFGLVRQHLRWQLSPAAVAATTAPDGALLSLTLPRQTFCAGHLQELVWALPDAAGGTCFLGNSPTSLEPGAQWQDAVTIAVANTPVEGLSALLRQELGPPNAAPAVLQHYEYLLDAFQLGLLPELENETASIFDLDETLHRRGFVRQAGGQVWTVKQQAHAGRPEAEQVTLPGPLAAQLAELNAAQKAYDQGRAQLSALRQQLFMDWLRYARLFNGEASSSTVTLNDLFGFIGTAGGSGALQQAIAAGNAVGVLQPRRAAHDGELLALPPPAAPASLAYVVWQQYEALQQALQTYPSWKLSTTPAPPFWQPTEPALVLESQHLAPVHRSGRAELLPVRLDSELPTNLTVHLPGAAPQTVSAAQLAALPDLGPTFPQPATVQALRREPALLAPMFGPAAVAALRPSDDGPLAAAPEAVLLAGLREALGGLNPLEGPSGGLFARAHAAEAALGPNPSIDTTTSPVLTVALTNPAASALLPPAVGWSAPRLYPALGPDRLDPFLPLFVVWEVGFDPLRRAPTTPEYAETTLLDFFGLDDDHIDYRYQLPAGGPAFTTGVPVGYTGSVALTRQPAFNLTAQLGSYQQQYPDDELLPALQTAAAAYANRPFFAFTLTGFNSAQTLRRAQPRVAVTNLVKGPRDPATTALSQAARSANAQDDWYADGFNRQAPVPFGPQAQQNFGPLRAGFLHVRRLEVVDVFGQRMQLRTGEPRPEGGLRLTAARHLHPHPDDAAHPNRAYLPPRLLAPTRLWFRWLSGRGGTADGGFVEMNAHPATSPVCGWLLPNHLDNSLLCYNDDGSAVGSFGVEHNELVYRTRAGNLANLADALEADLAPAAGPPVNPHLAAFMRYLSRQSGAFLRELLATTQRSETFLHAPGTAQDAGLAVLMGRPLALTRALLALETAGGVLPLSQADADFAQAVHERPASYAARQQQASAGLGALQVPVRLGDLAKADDGLVAFLPETAGPEPYQRLYAPAAPADSPSGVTPPGASTLQLTPNGPAQYLTLLIDPRAAVHATTGVLPVQALRVPPEQYAQALRQLAVTFFAHPVLRPQSGLLLPLPEAAGYEWSWVQARPAGVVSEALVPQAAQLASAGYSPQTLLEGWLRLQAAPDSPEPQPDPS